MGQFDTADLLNDRLEQSRRRLVRFSFWIFLSSSFVFTLLYLFSGSRAEAAGTFTVGLATLGIPVLLKRSSTSLNAAYLVVLLFYALLNFIVLVTDGLRSDTLHWLVLVPVFAQVLITRRAARTWLLVLLAEVALLFGLEMINFFNAPDVPELSGSIFRAISIGILFAVGYAIVSNFEANVRVILDEVDRSRSELEEAKGSVESRAGVIETNARVVSQSTREMLSVLEAGSVSMAQLERQMKEIDGAAQAMVGFVEEAVQQSHSVQDAMNMLQEQTGKIRRVLDLVGTISMQTNLLALNASVEASRAGAAGSGFQVVATEVKTLAGRSKEAIAEIDQVVQSLNRQMLQTVQEVSASAAKIDRVTEAHRDISRSLVQQQQASAQVLTMLERARQLSEDLSRRIGSLQA